MNKQIKFITSSTWCFTIRNSHGLCPPYIFIISLKNVLYISTIIHQSYDGTMKTYFETWNIWASSIIYFRFKKSKLQCLGHLYQREIYWGNVGRGSHRVPYQSDTRVRGEARSHGGGKVPGSAYRTWSHSAEGAQVDTVTSGNYQKTTFLRKIRRGHQVAGWKSNQWFTVVKYW